MSNRIRITTLLAAAAAAGAFLVPMPVAHAAPPEPTWQGPITVCVSKSDTPKSWKVGRAAKKFEQRVIVKRVSESRINEFDCDVILWADDEPYLAAVKDGAGHYAVAYVAVDRKTPKTKRTSVLVAALRQAGVR